MKYKHLEPKTTDPAFIVAVTSAFRSIDPSYTKTHAWYTKQSPTGVPSHVFQPIKSKYYLPIFGSVFASALALIMILTSQNTPLPTGTVAFKNIPPTNPEISTLSTPSDSTRAIQIKEERQLLAKIDAQSKATSRTQADESFTQSLNVETSLQDLFN